MPTHDTRRTFPRLAATLTAAFLALAALVATPPALHAQEGGGEAGGTAEAADAQEQLPVLSVEFDGNEFYSDERLRTVIRTRVGEPFSAETMNADVRRLFDQFSILAFPVAVHNEEAGGWDVTFSIIEEPIIETVDLRSVSGDLKLKRSTLAEDMRLQAGDYLSYFYLNRDLETLTDLHKEKGYQFVEVEHSIEKTSGGVRVVFLINEGPRVTVGAVRFEGNESFSDRRLRGRMATRPNGWFIKRTFDEEEFNLDLLRLQEWYVAQGHLNARVFLKERQYNADRTRMFLLIGIDEGPLFTVRDIRFEGNTIFTDDQLRAILRMESGDPVLRTRVNADWDAVTLAYGDRGHLDVNVQVTPVPLPDSPGQVDLVYSVEEGRTYRIAGVEVRGNTKTQDKVILRELEVFPGETFHLSAFIRSLQKLQNLGFFDRVSPRPPGRRGLAAGGELARLLRDVDRDPETGTARPTIEVSEAQTGSFRFGVGISSDSGLLGNFEITQRNFDITDLPTSWRDVLDGTAFAGAGQLFRIRLQPGSEQSLNMIQFSDPYILDKPVRLNVLLRQFRRDQDMGDENNYRLDRLGTVIGLEKRWRLGLDEYLSAGVSHRFDVIETSDVDASAAPPDLLTTDALGDQTLSGIELATGWNRTWEDETDYLKTTTLRAKLSYEIDAGFVGSDIERNLVEFNYGLLRDLHVTDAGSKITFQYTGRVAGQEPFGDSDDFLPVYERFSAGGIGSGRLRGLAARSVGPAQTDPSGELQTVGGDFLFIQNLDVIFPIYRNPDTAEDLVQGVVFLDWGTVTADVGDFEDIRVTTGFGVRLRIPFLGPQPLSFYFGFPVADEPQDEDQVFQFDFGAAFRF